MLTYNEYVDAYGERCPFCGSDEDVQVVEHGFEHGSAWSTSVCHKCDAEWTEEYEMARVTYNDGTVALEN